MKSCFVNSSTTGDKTYLYIESATNSSMHVVQLPVSKRLNNKKNIHIVFMRLKLTNNILPKYNNIII